MKLSTSWLLPAFIAATSASLEASVYLLQADNLPESSNPPTLSPEQARLIFAQRLGASKFHNLEDASATTLSYINKFGGEQTSLFGDVLVNRARELVLIVEGVSSQVAEPLLEAWSTKKPAFFISTPPLADANHKLMDDISKQISSGTTWTCSLEEEVNPFSHCWGGESKILHYDLSKVCLVKVILNSITNHMIVFKHYWETVDRTKKHGPVRGTRRIERHGRTYAKVLCCFKS